MQSKPSLPDKLRQLVDEYGTIAVVVHLSVFALTYASFYAALEPLAASMGIEIDSTLGRGAAAYVATRPTSPFRLAFTLAVTPLVASLLRRIRPQRDST